MRLHLKSFRLHPPQPNPTRGGATLRLDLPAPERVSIAIFDAAGREARALASNLQLSPGTHPFAWDGADDAGMALRSGLYFMRVNAGARSFTLKLTMLR